MIMRALINILFAAIVAMTIALCVGCGKKHLFNLTVIKEQESRVVSRMKLEMMHPDSAVIAGMVFISQSMENADSILSINRMAIHLEVDTFGGFCSDTGHFRVIMPTGELSLVARHYKIPSLNAKLNVIASSRDSIYVEMKIGQIFY